MENIVIQGAALRRLCRAFIGNANAIDSVRKKDWVVETNSSIRKPIQLLSGRVKTSGMFLSQPIFRDAIVTMAIISVTPVQIMWIRSSLCQQAGF
jgi:hypothetical protein